MSSETETAPYNELRNKLSQGHTPITLLPGSESIPKAKARSRKIRKLTTREILDADFVNASSKKVINELLLSQNVSTQNRTILSELWGSSNQKSLLPHITIGSPIKKMPLRSNNVAVPMEQNNNTSARKMTESTDEDTFQLNVIIPPTLMKLRSDENSKTHTEIDEYRDCSFDDMNDTMSAGDDCDMNIDSVLQDHDTDPEVKCHGETKECNVKAMEVTATEAVTNHDQIAKESVAKSLEGNENTDDGDTLIEDVAVTDEMPDGGQDRAGMDMISNNLEINKSQDKPLLKTNDEIVSNHNNEDIRQNLSESPAVDANILSDNPMETDEIAEHLRKDDEITSARQESHTSKVYSKTKDTNSNQIDQQKIIIPTDTKLYDESVERTLPRRAFGRPVVVIECMANSSLTEDKRDEIDKLWSCIEDSSDSSSENEDWIQLDEVEDDDHVSNKVYHLFNDVLQKLPVITNDVTKNPSAVINTLEENPEVLKKWNSIKQKRKSAHKVKKEKMPTWVVNGKDQPDPVRLTRGALRRKKLAKKLGQPYITRKRMKSTWIVLE